MRILIVSDTHRKNDNYFRILKKQGKLDMIIHCGDIEGSEYALSESADCPVFMISGNNDFFSELPRDRELNVGNYKVWVTHGHYYGVSLGIEMLKQEARSRGVQVVMFGHTHRPCIDIEDDLVAINPGSLSYPRQEGHKPSYALMEIDRHGEAHYTIGYL